MTENEENIRRFVDGEVNLIDRIDVAWALNEIETLKRKSKNTTDNYANDVKMIWKEFGQIQNENKALIEINSKMLKVLKMVDYENSRPRNDDGLTWFLDEDQQGEISDIIKHMEQSK